MALLNNNSNYIFYHLYKCAGNSLRDMINPIPHLAHIYKPKYQCVELGNAHSLPRDIQKIYYDKGQKDIYDNYFKFTIVRNPFDWLVSTYYYIIKNTLHNENTKVSGMTFSQFLTYYVDVMMKNQGKELGHNKVCTLYDYVSDEKGNVIVDYIGKYETLNDDMKFICSKIGVPYTQVPLINVNNKRQRGYKQYYDAESIKFVEENFAKDLEYFNYKF